jgi:hypothetical protein
MKKFLIAASIIANSGCGVLMTVESHNMIISARDKIIKRNMQEISVKKRTIEEIEEKNANYKYKHVVLNQSIKRKEKSVSVLRQQIKSINAKYADLNKQFTKVLAEKSKLESNRVKQIAISQDSKEFLALYLLALEEGYDGFFRQYAENFSESGHSSKSVEKEVRKIYDQTLKLGKKTIFEKSADFKIEYINKKVQGEISFEVGNHLYVHEFIVKRDLSKLKNSGINYVVGFKVKNDNCFKIIEKPLYDKYGDPVIEYKDVNDYEQVAVEKYKKVKKKYKCLKVNASYLVYTYNGEAIKYET